MARSSDLLDAESFESLRKNRPLLYAMNRLVIVAANAAIFGLLISAVVAAFAIGLDIGLRSLAAAALPPIVLAYGSFFARSGRSSGQRRDINLFLIGLSWILILLVMVNVVTQQFNHAIPLGEFVISLTLSTLFYSYPRLSARSRLSCAYGILSGFLLHLLIFGLPTR